MTQFEFGKKKEYQIIFFFHHLSIPKIGRMKQFVKNFNEEEINYPTFDANS